MRRPPTSSSARSRSGTTGAWRSRTRALVSRRRHHGCHRSDESGHDEELHRALAKEAPAWENQPRRRPTGPAAHRPGAKGNNRVAAWIKESQSSIGYVEHAYALRTTCRSPRSRTRRGIHQPELRHVGGGRGLTSARGPALQHVKRPRAAYPISTATFLLVYQDVCKGGAEDKAAAAEELAGLRARRRPGGRAGARVRCQNSSRPAAVLEMAKRQGGRPASATGSRAA